MKYFLLQISSILLFGVSATLNITGYINLFPNSVWMAGSILAGLELAKFTIVGVVYNMEDAIGKGIKSLLSLFLILLILISVIGHYAMLTSFYTSNQSTAIELGDNTHFIKTRMIEVKANIEELRALYKDFPKGYATKRMKVYKQVEPQIDKLQLEYKGLVEELNKARLQTQVEHKDNTNIFKASADLMGISSDKFALFIIILISVILDPLALLMVFTSHNVSNHIAKKKEEEQIELIRLEAENKALESKEAKDKVIAHNQLIRVLTDVKGRIVSDTSIEDIMGMGATDLSEFKATKLNSKEDREWFKLALLWREYGSIEGKDMSMDFSLLKDININSIYGRY